MDTAPTMPLTARTRRLDADVDLVALAGSQGSVFERDRCGLAGIGEALRIELASTDPEELARVGAVLATVTVDDDVGRPGTGPVAFASLPFHRHRSATFVVPRQVVGRAPDGTTWVTEITADGVGADHGRGDRDAPHGDSALLGQEPRSAGDRPRRYEVTAVQDPTRWMATVERARTAIGRDELAKVVLAREVVVRADSTLPRGEILQRLRRGFPGCFTFAVGDMVGASPELLVSRSGTTVRAHPMAGTAPRGGDPDTDRLLAEALLASTKDRAEHQITIDMVWETLLPFCSFVDSEPEPSIVAVANVQHLASLVEGRLSEPAAPVLDLVAALHPTPAVAGWPVAAAVDFLTRYEGLDRSTYAGAVGWTDAQGNGDWAVGIRSAIVEGTTARLFAGVGVVADSDPAAELAETDAKFQAVLSAIVRP